MHGAAQPAKAPPRRNADPLLRAPCTRPAPTSRSGHGSSPMNTSPNTIRTKPAICSSRNWFRVIERPTAAAPAPRSTNTATRPATNGTLATTTRRAAPGSPSRSASTDEIAERYPGTSGRTQGARKDTSPAPNATRTEVPLTARSSRVETGELVVDPTFERRVERLLALVGRLVLAGAGAAPAPDEHADGGGAEREAGEG